MLQEFGTDTAVAQIASIAQKQKKQAMHGFRAMLERVEANLQESGQDSPGETVRNAIVEMREHFTADTDKTRDLLSQIFQQAEQKGMSQAQIEKDLGDLLEHSQKLVPNNAPSHEEAVRQRLVGTPNALVK